jgi:hypothetical protein
MNLRSFTAGGEQNEFMKGGSFTDDIFTIWQIIEKGRDFES